MNIGLIIIFTMFHIVSDTIFQTDKQNVSKYDNKMCLLRHVTLYSINMTIPFILFSQFNLFNLHFIGVEYITWPLIFFVTMFISHYVIDNYVSKYLSILWEKKLIFFLLVQLDQFLHYLILFITLYFLQ